MTNFFPTFSENLDWLVQKALDNKTAEDGSDKARRWAIVRTELEKVSAYVKSIEQESE